MNMLSAHINFRDVQPAASDIYFLRRNRQTPVSKTEYHNMQSWYTENHHHYAELPIFKECGFHLDAHGYIQCDRNVLKRLPMLWGSPRWLPHVLSFTNRIDTNPTNTFSSVSLNKMLKSCINHKQAIILHVTNLMFIEHKEVLEEMAKQHLIHLVFSMGSTSPQWRNVWEPGTKSYTLRLKTIHEACSAGIPCGVLVEPVIPGESLQGLYELLRLVSQAGVTGAAYRLWNDDVFNEHKQSTYAKHTNTNQMQLKNGFISQFTHYCKQFQLNRQFPTFSNGLSEEKKIMNNLLF